MGIKETEKINVILPKELNIPTWVAIEVIMTRKQFVNNSIVWSDLYIKFLHTLNSDAINNIIELVGISKEMYIGIQNFRTSTNSKIEDYNIKSSRITTFELGGFSNQHTDRILTIGFSVESLLSENPEL
jgi:hypothetical protein